MSEPADGMVRKNVVRRREQTQKKNVIDNHDECTALVVEASKGRMGSGSPVYISGPLDRDLGRSHWATGEWIWDPFGGLSEIATGGFL